MIKVYGVVKEEKLVKDKLFIQLENKNDNGLYAIKSDDDGKFSGKTLEKGMLISAELQQTGKVYVMTKFIKDYTRKDIQKTKQLNKDDLSIHYDRISGIAIADKKNSSLKDIGKFNEKVVEYTNSISETRIKLKEKHSDLVDYIFGFTFGKAIERSLINIKSTTPITKIMDNVVESFEFMLPSYKCVVDDLEDKKPTTDLKKSSADNTNVDKEGWKDLEPDQQKALDQALDIFEDDIPS